MTGTNGNDGGGPVVPDLDFPASTRTRTETPSPASPPSPAAEVPSLELPVARGTSSALGAPPSVRGPGERGTSGVRPAPPASDDDDLGMEIERNMVAHAAPPATSSGSANSARPGARAKPRSARSGLEISHVRRSSRGETLDAIDEPSIATRAVSLVVALTLAGGAAAALLRFAHRPGGVDVTSVFPSAFDGTSAVASGAVAITTLIGAVCLGFVGVRSAPRSWATVTSGAALMFLALAMVTVTLSASEESETPPDGALLVPYLLPAAVLLLALGVTGRAAWTLAHASTGRRVLAALSAAAAGSLAFAAVELSRLLP